MTDDEKPLSTLVAQGWEIVNYAIAPDSSGGAHCVLLRKQKNHKLLTVRPKTLGKGYAVKELDV